MRRPASPDRNGFTLLETLIALALVGIIMSTVWSLLTMFARVERQGAERALKLQLVRSICMQLQNDLDRLAVPVDGSDVSGAAAPPPAMLIGSSSELQIFCRTAVDPWSGAAGRQTLATNPISDATSNSSSSTVSATGGRFGADSPYQLVRYQFTPSLSLPPNSAMQVVTPGPLDSTGTADNSPLSTPSGPMAAGNDLLPGAMLASSLDAPTSSAIGTSAMDGSQPNVVWAGLRRTESSWPVASPLVGAQVPGDEVPELKRCRFRYFDGARWLDSWGTSPTTVDPSMPTASASPVSTDSSSAAGTTLGNRTVDRLPLAVEIQFDLELTSEQRNKRPNELRSKEGDEKPALMELSGNWTPEYRWVVYLPAAERAAATAQSAVSAQSPASAGEGPAP
ncbi:MAG: type II secretion system protein [Pirellulales bacterium]